MPAISRIQPLTASPLFNTQARKLRQCHQRKGTRQPRSAWNHVPVVGDDGQHPGPDHQGAQAAYDHLRRLGAAGILFELVLRPAAESGRCVFRHQALALPLFQLSDEPLGMLHLEVRLPCCPAAIHCEIGAGDKTGFIR